MRKMITLIAAAALVASPFAFAEDNNTGNPNDVLQTVPGQENGPTIADATAPAAPASATAGDTAPSGNDASAETPKPTHHKHHVKKHHHHHHHNAPAATPSSEKETPNVLGTEMPAEHPAQ